MKNDKSNLQMNELAILVRTFPIARLVALLLFVSLGLVRQIGVAAEFNMLEDAGFVVGMSSDGNTVTGFRNSDNSRWRWTAADGLQTFRIPEGYSRVQFFEVNGGVFAGSLVKPSAIPFRSTSEPWLWTEKKGWEPLELPEDRESGSVYGGISADGTVVAGHLDDTATIWVNGKATTTLEEALGGAVSGTSGLSSDGAVVVGNVGEWDPETRSYLRPSDPESVGPYMWDSENGVTFLGAAFMGEANTAQGISSDGKVAFGNTRGDNFDAWRWSDENSFVTLGELPNASRSSPRDANVDGSVIVGDAFNSNATRQRAFVWDNQSGMRDLQSVLENDHGLQALPILNRAIGISDDGKVIAGYNIDSNGRGTDGWIVHLDRPVVVTSDVLGDFNNNAMLDDEDLDLLSAEVQAGRNVSLFDVNADNVVSVADRDFWVRDLANTYFGDANLDGEFNSGDLVNVFRFGEYEDSLRGNSGWAEGDWNADGDFTSSDLVLAFADGGYEKGPRPAASAVPEPTSAWLVLIAVVMMPRSVLRQHPKT